MNPDLLEIFELDSSLFPNSCASCIGGREENQDSCGITMTDRGLLVLVCDGMGGLNGGATASKTAVQTITDYILQLDETSDVDNKTALLNAITIANQKVFDMSETDPDVSGMGTTVTAMLINKDRASVAYVGDSRIYQIRHRRKVFRTFDHSMVFELVKKKVISEEQARLSAQSNIILRAVGIKPEVDIDAYDLPYDKGDVFLLCTDGIWGTMPEKQLIKQVSRNVHPRLITETLARTVNELGINSGGHHDNLTAAMVRTTRNSILRNKMESFLKKALATCCALLLLSLAMNVYLLASRPEAQPNGGENEERVDDEKLAGSQNGATVEPQKLGK